METCPKCNGPLKDGVCPNCGSPLGSMKNPLGVDSEAKPEEATDEMATPSAPTRI